MTHHELLVVPSLKMKVSGVRDTYHKLLVVPSLKTKASDVHDTYHKLLVPCVGAEHGP